MMRVIVCGGRKFLERNYVIIWLDKLFAPEYPSDKDGKGGTWLPRPDLVIITGACPTGVDAYADEWATVNWVDSERYPADWKRHGKAAGPIRNQRMIDEAHPDLVVAFPGGIGTADMVKRARKARIPVLEIP